MHRLLTALALFSLASVPASPRAQGEAERSRSQVPEEYRWKLFEMYKSDQDWKASKDAFALKLSRFARRRGHLGQGQRALADALADLGALRNEAQRLGTYAECRSDEDTQQAGPRGMKSEADSLQVKLDEASSFVRPELLALPPSRIEAALAAEPRLEDWRFYLMDLLRYRPHTLSAREERLFSMSGELASAGYDTFSVLTGADLPYPTVELSTGESIRLDPTGYEQGRVAKSREDRVKVFTAFFGALKGFERTLGTTLYTTLEALNFGARAHHFRSTLEEALFHDNIPVSVYQRLVEDVNQNLPTLHRYLSLRKKLLALGELGYEDLYTPLIHGAERRYTILEAQEMTLAAVAPLGEAYQRKLRHGYESGWTDFLPSVGKRSGAYSTGVYGIHPYQLLNFKGEWSDVSALAHESGHSMHTLLSYEHQPFPTAEYSTFVAEVASTLNENLLFHKALLLAKDDSERLSLLGKHLELLRGTLFRQVMFAEFELAIHERAEKGEALTGEKMSEIFLEVVRRYYGHEKGVCTVDARYGVEWAYVSHFYRDFYVYQYATSIVASTALAKAILGEEARGSTDTRDRFLEMLSSGGSDYPVELLKRAGVDMTTSAPFRAAMADMNETMDRIEAILAASPATPAM